MSFKDSLRTQLIIAAILSFLIVPPIAALCISSPEASSEPAQAGSEISHLPSSYWPTFLTPALEKFNEEDFEGTLKEILKQIKILRSDTRESHSRIASKAKIYLLRGLALKHLGRYSEAVSALRKATTHSPGNPLAHFHLGLALRKAGYDQEALVSFQEAKWFEREELLPASGLYYELALAGIEDGDTEKAAELLEKALVTNPEDTRIIRQLSEIRLQNGAKQEAINLLEQALKKNPEDYELNLQLVRTLLHNTDRVTGQASLRQASVLSQDLVDRVKREEIQSPETETRQKSALQLLIRSDIELGDFELASQTLDNALIQYPGSESFLRLKRQLEIDKSASIREAELEALREAERTASAEE